MSAKKRPKSAPAPAAQSVASTPSPAAAPSSANPSAAPVAWIDSDDPKKRQWAKVVLAGVWLYVAALFLLALDQTFKWGIFGP